MENEVNSIMLKKQEREIENITTKADQVAQQLQSVLTSKRSRIEEYIKTETDKINSGLEEKINKFTSEFSNDKQQTLDLIDSIFAENEELNFDNFVNTPEFLDCLSNTMSQEQIDAYEPHTVCEVSDIEESVAQLEYLEERQTNRKILNNVAYVLSQISLNTDTPVLQQYGVFLLIIILFIFASRILSTVIVLVTTISAIVAFKKGCMSAKLLDTYNSMYEYFENSDQNTRLQELKTKEADKVNKKYDEVYSNIISKINSKRKAPKIDTTAIEQEIDEQVNVLNSNRTSLLEQLSLKKEAYEKNKQKLADLEHMLLEESNNKEKIFLSFDAFEWKKELMPEIYIGKNKKGLAVMHPISKGNVIYIADTKDILFEMAKLISVQLLIHVHPDYIEQIVLDYKYMGGQLQPMAKIPKRCLTLYFEKSKIDDKITSIMEEITARVNNILSDGNDIESFNTTMTRLGGSIYSYTIVHIFGLSSVNQELLDFLQNGAKVGFFFYIYLTKGELKELGSEELITLCNYYFQIIDNDDGNPMPDKRLRDVVMEYLEKNKK